MEKIFAPFATQTQRGIVESTWTFVKFSGFTPLLHTQIMNSVQQRYNAYASNTLELRNLIDSKKQSIQVLAKDSTIHENLIRVWYELELLRFKLDHVSINELKDTKELGSGTFGAVTTVSLNSAVTAKKRVSKDFATGKLKHYIAQEVYMMKYAHILIILLV